MRCRAGSLKLCLRRALKGYPWKRRKIAFSSKGVRENSPWLFWVVYLHSPLVRPVGWGHSPLSAFSACSASRLGFSGSSSRILRSFDRAGNEGNPRKSAGALQRFAHFASCRPLGGGGLVSVAVPGGKLKVVPSPRPKGVPLEATKNCFFK